MAEERRWKNDKIQIAALLFAAVIINIAYTILIPLVPSLESRFGMDSFTLGGTFAGFALMKMLFQPVGGLLVDRYEAKYIACFGLIVGAASTLALGTADRGWEVVSLRVVWGMGEGIAIPALFRLCFTVRCEDPKTQRRIVAWFGAAEVGGMAIGPGFVGLFEPLFGFQGVFRLAAAVTVFGALTLVFFMGSSRTNSSSHDDANQHPGIEHAKKIFGTVGALVLAVALVDFVNNVLYAALEPALPLYVAARWVGTNTLQFIAILFFMGLLIFSLTSLWAGKLLDRFGVINLIAIAFVLAGVGLVIQGIADGELILAAGFLVFMMSQPLVYVATRTIIGSFPPQIQGRAFGYFGLVAESGWVIGPILGVSLIRLWDVGLFVAFAAFSFAFALAAVCLGRCYRSGNPQEN